MKEVIDGKRWVLCPICGAKTRLKLLPETELKAFPLFCPKCSQTLRRSADRKADHALRLVF